MEIKSKSQIIVVLITIFFMAFVAMLIYFLYELENQVSERNVIIENLQKENEELINKTNNLSIKGKTITVDELVKYTNSLNREIDSIKTELEYYKVYYDMSQDMYHNNFSKRQKNATTYTYTLDPKVPGLNEYNAMAKEYDSLKVVNSHNTWALKQYGINLQKKEDYIKANAPVIDSLRRRQQMLEFAIKTYGIKINESKDGKSYSVKAPKIDSALMLLPHYRDMLERKNDSVWTITHPKK